MSAGKPFPDACCTILALRQLATDLGSHPG
jgi:hypothetical protein